MDNHPFMIASQFHPEFLSRPTRPHPLFLAFVKAAAQRAGVVEQGFDIETDLKEQES